MFARIFPVVIVVLVLGLTTWGYFDVSRLVSWVTPKPITVAIPTPPDDPYVPPTPMPSRPVHITGDFLQLGSYKTVDEAKKAIVVMSKYSDLFSANRLTIARSVLPNGTWYRVLLPVASRNVASVLCEKVKARGGDCLVLTVK